MADALDCFLSGFSTDDDGRRCRCRIAKQNQIKRRVLEMKTKVFGVPYSQIAMREENLRVCMQGTRKKVASLLDRIFPLCLSISSLKLP